MITSNRRYSMTHTQRGPKKFKDAQKPEPIDTTEQLDKIPQKIDQTNNQILLILCLCH